MGYYEDQLKTYQNKIRDLASPKAAAQDVSQVRARLGDVASQFGRGARDLVSGAGEDVIEKSGRRIRRRAEDIGNVFELRRSQTRLNQLYNTIFQEYLDAGYELRQSDAAARQLAQDQFVMEQQAQEGEASRAHRKRKADVDAQYQTAMSNLQPDLGNPYEQALLRSLFGLGTAAVTYKILKGKDKKDKAAISPANYDGTYAGSGTYAGRLREAFNRQDVRPYTSDFGTRGRVGFR